MYCRWSLLSTGDEDNGEQGAWFVLSALGLFSTVPGSPDLVLGSPIFKHVRIWRGKCKKNPTTNEAICDYSDSGSGEVVGRDMVKNGGSSRLHSYSDKRSEAKLKTGAAHIFPSDSSYLDIVALGTADDVTKVSEITLNGNKLPASTSDYSTTSGFNLGI